jgi:hypothetical protein
MSPGPASAGLRVVGAGLPRTGTVSLCLALSRLLGAPCHHMRDLPGHPYDLGPEWSAAIDGDPPDWSAVLAGYAAAVGWPASMWWRELAELNPGALVLLSLRDSTDTWLDSMDSTALPVARMVAPEDWIGGRDLARLMERFAGPDWDDREVLRAAHDDWVAGVRRDCDPGRLLEWRPGEGWDPLCTALGVPVPDELFPLTNRREDWPL